MHVRFVKMIQFSRQFMAGGRPREFNFRKLNNPEADTFTVNVSDERGNRIVFAMQKKEQEFKILPAQLPTWIIQNEAALQSVIHEEMAAFQ